MIPDPRDTSPPGGLRARAAAAAVREGRLGAQSLLDDARRWMENWEPGLGAVVARADETAGQAAGALAGVVTGVKDLLWVRGVPRRCGAPELTDDTPAPADAEAVARLREAGATIAATLATHQFAYGIVTPQTGNPVAPGRVAGGSSGGSAAAVAAGLVHLALGTDTGGSVRIPAACCGVVGVKPTFGAVPVAGVQPLAPSLDTVGLLAGDVDDAALALPVLLGRALPARGGDLRVGVPLQTREAVLNGEVRARWERVCTVLRGQGVPVEEIDLPGLADAPRANGLMLGLEALETHGALLAARPDGWWPDVRERLDRARALTPDDRRWAEQVRDGLRAQLEEAFGRVHVLLTPTLPCRVPVAGASHVRVGDRDEAVTPAMTRLTNPWNLVGAPAGSLPAGRDSGGAPIGMQVIAPWHAEHVLLGAMRLIQETAVE